MLVLADPLSDPFHMGRMGRVFPRERRTVLNAVRDRWRTRDYRAENMDRWPLEERFLAVAARCAGMRAQFEAEQARKDARRFCDGSCGCAGCFGRCG